MCRFEFASAPEAGTTDVKVYWAGSVTSDSVKDNPGGTVGVDGDYKNGDELEWVEQLTLIGIFHPTADADIAQVEIINDEFMPPTRWGMPVVLDNTGVTWASDAVEMCVAFVPIVDEVQ